MTTLVLATVLCREFSSPKFEFLVNVSPAVGRIAQTFTSSSRLIVKTTIIRRKHQFVLYLQIKDKDNIYFPLRVNCLGQQGYTVAFSYTFTVREFSIIQDSYSHKVQEQEKTVYTDMVVAALIRWLTSAGDSLMMPPSNAAHYSMVTDNNLNIQINMAHQVNRRRKCNNNSLLERERELNRTITQNNQIRK